ALFFQAEDGIRDFHVTGVQTCALPILWEKPIGQPLPPGQIVEQVWFSGVHSNIGGSYPDSDLSDITLDWMIKRLRVHTGLAIDRSEERRVGKECRSRWYPSQ